MIKPLPDTCMCVKLRIEDKPFIVGSGDNLAETRFKVNELVATVNRLEKELKALKESK